MTKSTNKYFVFGLVCILCASLILINNLYEDYRVGEETRIIANKIIYNKYNKAKVNSHITNIPVVVPTEEINGKKYIGYLKIKKLGLSLPVMDSWSYENIKISPARYRGSVYEKNMIVLAHNYKSHFGNIHRLKSGDIIEFYDIGNNKFVFTVNYTEEISGKDVRRLISGKWDLTLFTCTLDGIYRTVVRCKSVN